MPFVFYDTETTGTAAPFDQILQFAAIKTDDEFNEVDRFEIRCRLLPHVVPAPMAMLITRVRAHQLSDPALPSHYEMVRRIQEKLTSWSPATFIGFNSIDFDEHLLRQAFYQTLHRPYLTSAAESARCDIMRIAQACSIFFPEAISVPVGDKGFIFKLGGLAAANGFGDHNAHDAMGDVLATIHLARVLSEKAPDVWSAAMRFGKKAACIDHLESEQIICFGEVYFGRPYGWTATCIGRGDSNNSDHYLYDLSIDPESLSDVSEAQLVKRIRRSPKPVRLVKANAGPIFMDFPDHIRGTSSANETDEILRRRAEYLEGDEDLRKRLIQAYLDTKEDREPSPHVEAQIYDDFTSDTDWLLCEKFHSAPWEKREAILAKLADPRLKKLGRRLIAIERPDVLHTQARDDHFVWLKGKLLSEEEELPWLTLPFALSEIDGLIAEAEGADAEHLGEHRAFLVKLRDQL
jgi:exodeoxyribonuclease-1